jgi:all-trans-retinol 13,14-reductase
MLLAVLIGLSLCVSLVLRVYFRHKQSQGRNPFSLGSLREPEPFQADKDVRRSVLKRRFTPEEVPSDVDVIVIGSGIGGLCTGALLSKAGKRVLVLEQHSRAGGCCHTFHEKGLEFDVGIHYIGEMGADTIVKNLSDQISNNQLKWAPLHHNFDIMVSMDKGNSELKYYGNRDETIQSLEEAFPGEKEAIRKFFYLIQSNRGGFTYFAALKLIPYCLAQLLVKTGLVHKFTNFFKAAEKSLWDVVCETTDNEELRIAFVYFFMNYGTKPDIAGWPIHSMLVEHYKHGAFYPEGGASQIPFTTIKVIEEGGGKVLMRAPVSTILFDSSDRACGVRVKDTDIQAPLIISDAGVINTFNNILPKEIAAKSRYKEYGTTVDSGETAFQIFVGLNGSNQELGLVPRNYWVYRDSKDMGALDRYMNQSLDDAVYSDANPPPILFISFPSAKDPTWDERFPGKSSCIVAGPANYHWFKEWENKKVKKRGDDYEHLKRAIGEKMMETFRELFPHLADKVEFWDVGTPITHVHYIAAPKGEIAGLNHSPFRFSPEVAAGLRPKTDIPGLYLTGQDVSVCGFTGAMFGGLLCASAILKRNLLNDLLEVKKQRAQHKKNK